MSFQPPEVTSTGYHRQLVKNGRPRTSTSRKWKIVKIEKWLRSARRARQRRCCGGSDGRLSSILKPAQSSELSLFGFSRLFQFYFGIRVFTFCFSFLVSCFDLRSWIEARKCCEEWSGWQAGSSLRYCFLCHRARITAQIRNETLPHSWRGT